MMKEFKGTRMLNKSHIYSIHIPDMLDVFLKFHMSGCFSNKRNHIQEYDALLSIVSMLLEAQLEFDEPTNRLDPDERDVVYRDYILDCLEQIDSKIASEIDIVEVDKFVAVLNDLISNIISRMIELDIHTKDFIVIDIDSDKIILEVSYAADSGKQDIFYPTE